MPPIPENFAMYSGEELVVLSPGRINLIGEHTDYNNGFVLPTAIDKHIVFSFEKNHTENQCNVYSATYDKTLNFSLNSIKPSTVEWENYILGVLHELLQMTSKIKGFRCHIESRLPIGSGISSSAALECGLAYGLNALFDIGLSKIDLVRLSQRAEHHYVGTQCGIMDQFASVMSVPQKVIFLDCMTEEYRMIDAHFDPYQIVLLNTNVSHNLASSQYNTRREECEESVALIAKKYNTVTSLRDVTKSMLNTLEGALPLVLFQRALYVVEENDRVVQAAEYLEKGALKAFGALMYQSHKGLQYQYEVSCEELDFLVYFSENHDHIIGSRMMGGGFGGCTINLIHKAHTEAYINQVAKAYHDRFSIPLTPLITLPGQGTSIRL